MQDVKRNLFRAYLLIDKADGSGKEYHVIGKRSSEGTLAFGTTVEAKNIITNKKAINVATEGAWSLPIATDVDIDDDVYKALFSATEKGQIDKEWDVLIVWEFCHRQGKDKEILAHHFKALLPLTDIGGTGQATMTSNFTISNSGDIDRGFVNTDQTQKNTAVYDPAKDIYKEAAFTIDAEGLTNFDPTAPTVPDSGASGESLEENSEKEADSE